jgi:hypothetical protein
VATDEQLDTLVCFVDSDQVLRSPQTTFGAMSLFSALPLLSDSDFLKVVDDAIELGFFKRTDGERITFTLEGRRRAHHALVEYGYAPALYHDYGKLADFALSDAIILTAKDISQARYALWIEDLYVAFSTTNMAALQGAITKLRSQALLRQSESSHLDKWARGLFATLNREWASSITREALRHAATLNERKDVAALLLSRKPQTTDKEMFELVSEEDIVAFLRSIPRGLRELDDKHRRSGAEPFVVENEYDVQDFVRAYLRMRFPERLKFEESTPSTAGKGGRVDFLLEEHRYLIELKVFQNESHWKSTMFNDITAKFERYGNDTRCDVLFIFIYDPERQFRAAAQAETELSSDRVSSKGRRYRTRIVVAPQ